MTGGAMVSELLIALFAGMIAVVTFRRNTPRAVEAVLWAGLIWVCVLAVTSVGDRQSRAVTGAAVWGASQMLGTITAVAQQSVLQWLVDRRFLIADWVVLLFGACLLLLILLMARREALGWQPRVRLRDWMELPSVAQPPQRARVTESAVEEINQRFRVWAPVASAAAMMWLTLLLIWTGDVLVPTTERKLRSAALRAELARRRLAAANWRGLMEKAGSEPLRLTEQVVDIEVLARRASAARVKAADWLAEVGSTPQVSWFSGFGAYPTDVDGGIDLDVTERDRRDRLAS
jgi:hypothetical protein